ncbi:MAG: peptidoglycan DD-metalloendopeptidase family protein [Rhizobiales bacterium]|nr:peptidoglycan DD-metalloendopeptidase family protein [Hyphomicrobiales bacterium]
MRLDAFSNPFSSSSADVTNSVPAPTPGVNPKLRGAAMPTASGNYATAAVASPRLGAAAPVTGNIAGWSATGGTPIVLAQGENLSTISQRYGVPEAALLQSNGFTSAAQVQPGARLVVPVYNAGASAARAAAPAVTRPAIAQAPLAPPTPRLEQAKPSRPLTKAEMKAEAVKTAKVEPVKANAEAKVAQAKAPAKVAQAKVAQAKSEPAKKEVAKAEPAKLEPTRSQDKAASKSAKVETKPLAKDVAKDVAKPVAKAEAAPVKQVRVIETKQAPAKPEPAPEPVKAAKVEKATVAEQKKAADPATTASLPPAEPEKTADAGGSPEFRWPARGRVIQGFRSNGNDGINIAVPEGTTVKAAEGGVVAYAGSELKGYGNLVLIRHPNGFVSAYAHNGEIAVKRGEQVKRGQSIAKSGQSGNVSTPQLHFELRKGSTPVDPTQYLAGL